MIIRPACEDEFTIVPNVIFTDRRMDADARAMVGLLISKPKNWKVIPRALGKELSRDGGRPVGKKRLRRMFAQVMAAGYVARSLEQTHKPDGDWGSFIYFVGLPDDVRTAVDKSGVAILAQVPLASARGARAPKEPTHTYKRRSLENNNQTNSPPYPPRNARADTPLVGDEVLTEFGQAARDAGCKFIYEGSAPFAAWLKFRGDNGMPPIDVVTEGGIERRGMWLGSLYPPRMVQTNGGEA